LYRHRVFRVFTMVVAVAAMTATDVRAQSSLQFPLQFDFLNPGARSLALGSAFAGLADDATAAFTNPAGLTILTRLEASFEFRGRRFETPFLRGGRLSGTVSNVGLDTAAGPLFGTALDTSGSIGFLSIVYPKGGWRLAGYTHELVNISGEFESQGVFQQFFFQGIPLTGRELPQTGRRSLRIRNYGGSVAYQFQRGVSIGVNLSAYDSKLESEFRRFDTVGGNNEAPANFASEAGRATQNGDGISLGGSVGVLWAINPKVRLGAVYRSGPVFDFEVTQRSGPGSPETRSDGEFRVPNTFSAGLVVRPTDTLTLTTEYTRVSYSRLEEDFVVAQGTQGRGDQFFVEDGNEFHAGVEYVLANVPKTPALRVGAWYDPDKSVQFRTVSGDSLDERLAVALSQGEAVVHYTFGGGLSLSPRFELNAAADLSKRTRVGSASIVVRF
jgi:long-chain fatty acid transport protein